MTRIVEFNSVTRIGDFAFNKKSYDETGGKFTSVTIGVPEGAAESAPVILGHRPFGASNSTYSGGRHYNYDWLTSITINKSFSGTGKGFYGVTGQTQQYYAISASLTSVTLGSGVTSIGDYALQGCENLTSITLPAGVTRIGTYAFSRCSRLASVNIPDGVSSIGDRAFSGCTVLRGSVTLNGVSAVGDYAFDGCRGLTGVTFGSPLLRIGLNAFNGCTGLSSVTFPAALISIGNNAFAGCTNLRSITSLAAAPPVIQDATFQNVPKTGNTLVLPQESEATYYATLWRELIGGYHQITYNAGGGTVDPTVRYVRGRTALGVVPTPARSGYAFGGWFTEQNGAGTQYTATTVITATVELYAAWEAALVTSVTVTPATANVQKGGTQQFAATVTETGGAAQTVTWSITGHALTATNIDVTGLLTIAASETATSLTVTATSTHDNTKQGTAEVTLTTAPEASAVTSVTVTPNPASVQKGQTQQFAANVAVIGNAPQTVTWSVSGNTSNTTVITTGVAGGLLTVAADETATVLTVTATSTHDNTKQGTAAVTVKTPPVTPIEEVAVSGTVAGAPIGTEVQLYEAAGSTVKASVPGGYSYVASTTTNASGHYLFDHLPPGVYIVLVVMQGHESEPTPPISLEEGTTASDVNFTVKGDTVIPDDDITGVGELLAPDVKVYPNPFTDAVRIAGADGCILLVINSAGVVVHTQKITGADEAIGLEHLPAGMYFLRIEKDGKVKTVKVMKQ